MKTNVGKEILYLTREECIDTGLSPLKIVELVEKALVYQAKEQVEMPAKIGIHPLNEDTFLHAMPSYIQPENICGLKWISGFPDNPIKHNLPHITGLLILNDNQTGLPIAIMDGTWVTTMRTVAATMIGAKYLGDLTPGTFGMIGCGDIGRNHIAFIPEVLPEINTIYIYDKYEQAMDRVIEEFQPKMSAKIIKAQSMDEVVKNSAIVASATIFSKPNPQIDDASIMPGQTLLLCDAHALYEDKTIKRSDKYVIDSLEQGEHFNKFGFFTNGLPNVHAELGQVVAGMKKGREDNKELIVNNNIGMAIEDVIVGKAIYQEAIAKQRGRALPL